MADALAILSVLLLSAFLWGRFWPFLLTTDEVEGIAARPVHQVVLSGYAAWNRAGWMRRLACILFGNHYRVADMGRVFWMASTGKTEMLVSAWEQR